DEAASVGSLAPGSIDLIVRRLLDKDPARRFQTANEALAALSNASSAAALPVDNDRRGLPAIRRAKTLAAAALVAAIVVGAVWLAKGRIDRRVAALAVLPLRDLSADANQAYFAAEMTSAIASELLHLSGVRVVADTAAMSDADVAAPLTDLARRMHVEAVLEGSVQRAGDRVTVSMTLMDAHANRPMWT